MFDLANRLFTNVYGDRVVHGIQSEWEARAIMEQLGLKYERVYQDVLQGRTRYWDAPPEKIPGIHQYFMQGVTDIAYYTQLMGTLFIHVTPRPWTMLQ